MFNGISKACAVLFGLAILAGSAFAQSDALLEQMRKSGEAKIAIATSPPWATLMPNGEAQGYLIDLTTQALKGMGVPRLAPTVTTWDAMIPGLQAKRFDFIPAGLLITPARCQAVVFSSPVNAQQDALYVLPGNPRKLNSINQVAQSPDVKISVMTGSAQEAYALRQGVKPDQLVRVPDIQAGIATVTGGRANAFIVGQFSVPGPREKGVEVVVDQQAPVFGMGIAFRKEDVAFRDAFNRELATMRANGAMQNLYATKYGMPNWDALAKATKTNDVSPGCE